MYDVICHYERAVKRFWRVIYALTRSSGIDIFSVNLVPAQVMKTSITPLTMPYC